MQFCSATNEIHFLMAKDESSKVNYIQHLLAVSEKFFNDDRLGASHISLYYALFHTWNMAKFKNPISIARQEMMRASKIGSANTYTKCLKELAEFNYLKYNPSYNPLQGSTVYLYKFDKGSDNGSDKGTDKGTDKGSVMVVIPYTNSLNNTNNINSLKRVNSEAKLSHAKKNKIENEKSKSEKESDDGSDDQFLHQPNEKNASIEKKVESLSEIPSQLPDSVEGATLGKKEKSSGQKEKVEEHELRAESRCQRPLLQQVQSYFQQKNSTLLEAEKYFNYYQSNGWLVGGKTPMHDWQASANKWILNHQTYSKTRQANNLSTPNNKQYDEPL